MSIDQLLTEHLEAAAELTPLDAGPAPEMVRAAGRRRTNRRNVLVGSAMAIVLVLGGVGIWSATTGDDQSISVANGGTAEGRVATWSPVVATDDGFVAFRNVYDDLDGDPHVEIFRSDSGDDWTRVDAKNFPSIFVQRHAFYDDGRYVVIGSDAVQDKPFERVVATSTDLVNWTSSVLVLASNGDRDNPYSGGLAAYSSDHGLVLAFKPIGGTRQELVFRSSDLVNFRRVDKLANVTHLTSSDDGLLAISDPLALQGDVVLWRFARYKTGEGGSWRAVRDDEAGTFRQASHVDSLDGAAAVGVFAHSGTPSDCLEVQNEFLCPLIRVNGPQELHFSPHPGAPFAPTGIAGPSGGDLQIEQLDTHDSGYAVSFIEFVPDEEFDADHIAFSADGVEWAIVAADLDGWVSTLALGENEIIATVMSDDSFETELVRIPITEN